MINKQFIEDLMPQYPIYLELLPEDAIAAIGKVHTQTQPALEMLKRQGFVQKDLVDIFDAGAVVHCNTREIAAVRNARPCVLSRILKALCGVLLGSAFPSFESFDASFPNHSRPAKRKRSGGIFATTWSIHTAIAASEKL
jgi:hypothetical protein